MITRVYADGFKGLDFDQPLALRTLITGRVGSGKSARALALALLVTGGLPGTGIARLNAEIFKAVGGGCDTLMVGVEVDGRTFERTFRRKKNGTVTTDCRIDGEPIPKNLFEMELDREGVSIADVSGFLVLSDARKIDDLFRLFPPAGDVRGLTASITTCKDRISAMERDLRAREQSRQALSDAIADLHLPAGSLPEIQARIAMVEGEYQTARDELVREKARLEHEAELAARNVETPAKEPAAPVMSSIATTGHTASAPAMSPIPEKNEGMTALKRVLSALNRAGCSGCAARMVLMREMKQMKVAAHG